MSNPSAANKTTFSAPIRESAAVISGRVVAIDALRGFDMFWIVGGAELLKRFVEMFSKPMPEWLSYHLEHRKWEGFTAWDLIMPLFLFVVGAAMPFSFSRRLEEGQSKARLYGKILTRTLVLFVLGMACQGNLLDFNPKTYHVFSNTLQAIAVGYLIAGIVMLNVGVVGQIVFAAAMMIGYWLILMYVPLAGGTPGSLEPQTNVAYAVDRWVFGRFIDGTNPPYTWALSGMTFSATVLLGVFAGHVLRSRLSPWGRVVALALLGLGCLAAGRAWQDWLGFTIIKHLWTSSMVLWAGGWSYLLLALFYLVIDVLGFRRWAFPFIVIGMNAITIYVAWDFVPFAQISKNLFGGLAKHLAAGGPFLLAFGTVLIWWLILYHMYRRKIFLRI
jgi:predicted acyltransferase